MSWKRHDEAKEGVALLCLLTPVIKSNGLFASIFFSEKVLLVATIFFYVLAYMVGSAL